MVNKNNNMYHPRKNNPNYVISKDKNSNNYWKRREEVPVSKTKNLHREVHNARRTFYNISAYDKEKEGDTEEIPVIISESDLPDHIEADVSGDAFDEQAKGHVEDQPAPQEEYQSEEQDDNHNDNQNEEHQYEYDTSSWEEEEYDSWDAYDYHNGYHDEGHDESPIDGDIPKGEEEESFGRKVWNVMKHPLFIAGITIAAIAIVTVVSTTIVMGMMFTS